MVFISRRNSNQRFGGWGELDFGNLEFLVQISMRLSRDDI